MKGKRILSILIIFVPSLGHAALSQDESFSYPDESTEASEYPLRFPKTHEQVDEERWGAVRRASQDPPARQPGPDEATVSLSTLKAPRKALALYGKARKELDRGRTDKAKARLEDAVRVYPGFAAAWHGLGLIHRHGKRPDEARQAFEKALAADAKYWKPYAQLAIMAAEEEKWEDTVAITARAMSVLSIPAAPVCLYHAIGSYQLGRADQAEESARCAIRRDDGPDLAKAHHVLGLVLYQKNDLEGAAVQLQAYLAECPDAPDQAVVREQLALVEAARRERLPVLSTSY